MNAAHREHDAAAMVGTRRPHTAGGLRILAGDDVEHEVAIGTAVLDRADHPLPRQLDPELLGNFFAELDLKSRGPVRTCWQTAARSGLTQEAFNAPRSMTASSERASAGALQSISEARLAADRTGGANGRPHR